MAESSQAPQKFEIQRIFLKDISFESPNSPSIFQKEWKAETKLDLDTKTKELGNNFYEVELRLTVTTKSADETAFLCEIQQAGIFIIENLESTQLARCLGAVCPSILFPYASETISSLVTKGTFPQLNLAPVNFEGLFANYLKSQAEAQEKERADA